MMRYEIRAMSFGEILDTGFRLIRDHFGVLVGTAAVLYVPTAVLTAYLTRVLEGAEGLTTGVATAATMLVLLGLVVSPVVFSAITHAVGEVYLGRSTTVGACLRVGFSILLPLVGTTFLAAVAVAFGLLLVVIPGIYLMLTFLLMWPVMVLEKTFGVAALRRSREIMAGNLLRGFGVLFVTGLIVSVLSGVFQLAASLVPVLGPVASGVAQAIGVAYHTAVAVVLYFDIRCRKEAFEIEHLAQLVSAGAPMAAAPTT
jgi:hypothetical protein